MKNVLNVLKLGTVLLVAAGIAYVATLSGNSVIVWEGWALAIFLVIRGIVKSNRRCRECGSWNTKTEKIGVDLKECHFRFREDLAERVHIMKRVCKECGKEREFEEGTGEYV